MNQLYEWILRLIRKLFGIKGPSEEFHKAAYQAYGYKPKTRMEHYMGKIKQHFVSHKEAYIVGGFCLLIGAAVALVITDRLRDDISVSAPITSDSGDIILNTGTFVNLARRGHPGNVVRCVETSEIFASQNRAAAVMEIDPSLLSKHLNGLLDHVKGMTFELVGECQ